VLTAAQRVAKAIEAALRPDGINLLQANGPGAAQSVFHFHVHILPRRIGDDLRMNWGHKPGDMAAIRATFETIKAAL
jgi:histidine triad (HIT) family protein